MKLPEEPKKSRLIQRAFSTFFRVMALVMFGTEMLLAGFALGKGNESGAAADAILALFWLGFLVITHLEAISDAKWQESSRWFDKMIALLKTLADAEEKRQELTKRKEVIVEKLEKARAEAEEHAHDHDVLESIIKDLKLPDNRLLTPAEITKIEAAFHENTDRYVGFEYIAELKKHAVHFGAEPFSFEQPKPTAKRVRKPRAKKVAQPTPAAKTDAPLPGQTELPINKETGGEPKAQDKE